MRITSRQQLAANGAEELELSATNSKGEFIKPSLTAKILGITFQNSLNWTYHFERGGEAVLSKCKKKLGALKFVAKNSSIKMKKRLADGCIMSRLIYGIQLWGLHMNKSPLKKVQRVQNMTMCWILGVPWWTRTVNLSTSMVPLSDACLESNLE